MTQKAIFDLPIGAGQYTEQSERGAVGRWYTMDKVRFRKGLAEKIGGWSRVEPQFIGTCRRLLDWSSLDTKRWSAIATDTKLYVWQDGTLFDITPLRDSGTLTDPFTTSIGLATVDVAHTNHGEQEGSYVSFANATAVGGITIDGEYQVTAIIDANSYTITHTVAASGSAVGGGTVDYEYDLNAGATTAVTATGYGTGPYGREGYGNARTGSTLVLPIRTWSLDTWGEDLLANPNGGAIYWWDRSKGTGERAMALGGDAPPTNGYMLVSQRDRHVIALGAYDFFNNIFDPLLIRWSSTEDLNDWVPVSTNTSGDLRLYSGSKIVTGVRSRLETVVFTDVSVHTMPFFGGFEVFGLNTVGENVSILGPNAAVPIDSRVVFMAESDFYVYDGVTKVLNCDVRNWVYDNINVDQRAKVYGGLNREFNEVWWFYPSFDPMAYTQQPFDLTLPPGYELADDSGGTIGYTYQFNSGGFTEVQSTANNNYQHDYILTNDEPIPDPLNAEYAVELDVSDLMVAQTGVAGLTFLRQNLTGTADTQADDAKLWAVELDYQNNLVQIVRWLSTGGPAAPGNLGGNTANFTTLTGSAMALDTKYVITAQVLTTLGVPQITVWVDGVQAFQFDMDATEIADFVGSASVALHVRADVAAENDDAYRFYNLSSGPIGVLTAADFDISPIEVNRYVIYNYEEGTWATGMLARTAWADRSPLFEKAYATGTDGYLYQHETGTDDNGVAMTAYIESFDMEIPNAGEELMHVDQLIPDFLTLEGSVSVNLTGRKYPAAERITKGPYTVTATTRKNSTRIRARQIAIKVTSSDTGDKWRMGTWRGRAGPHGKRG